MKILKKSNFRIWTDIITLLLILSLTAIISAQFHVHTVYNDNFYDMSSEWITEDGQTVSLSELPAGKVTITHMLSEISLTDNSFCIKSSDTFINILIDGNMVYQYAPVYAPLIGKSYGNYIHVIPLPDNAKQITMTLTPIYSGDTADLRSASIENPAKFIIHLYRQGLPGFIACLVMVVFGIMMMILEIIGETSVSDQPMGFLSLGIFSVIIGIWSMNDTYVLQVFTERPEIIKIICYFCIMLIAYPPVSFIASTAKRNDTRLLPVLAILIILNFISTLTLSGFGIVDPHYMLLFSHLNIVTAMCMTIYLMIQAIRNKTIEKRFLLTIIIGMTAALIGVGIDLLRFWFVKNSEYGSSSFTRVGVLIFIIAEGVYLLKAKNRMIIERGNAELMKKMAYTDALTGLSNRAAYHEKEKILKNSEKNYTIALLDINWLKTVNDEYGHAEGDKHIIAAATAIRDSLSALGTCYRIGGDEFAAILNTDDTKLVEQALEKLEQAEKAYNQAESPPVPLQIAYGYALYFPQNTSLETTETMADQRMYTMKRMMKTGK